MATSIGLDTTLEILQLKVIIEIRKYNQTTHGAPSKLITMVMAVYKGIC